MERPTTSQIISKVRQIEIKMNSPVEGLISGAYLSAFKGTGIEFSQVREYQAGDDTGNFDYRFKKGEESSNISGRMNAGKMDNIRKQSTEDIKKLMQYIESNETFRQMNRTLSDKGYNMSSRNIDLETNISRFEYSYRDQQGRNASITSNVTNAGEIKDIILKEPEPPFSYWIPAILVILVLGIYLFTKSRNKEMPLEPVKETIIIDHRKNALYMLEKAISLFNDGRKKEAYLEASKDDGYLQDVKEYFMLCDLLKFAKYEPNEQDFNRVVEYARRIID